MAYHMILEEFYATWGHMHGYGYPVPLRLEIYHPPGLGGEAPTH